LAIVHFAFQYNHMDFLYKRVLKPILFLFDPEVVHDFFIWSGESLGGFGLTRKLTSFFYGYNDDVSVSDATVGRRDISKTVDGIRYRIPVLLSAGFDYDGRLTQILPSLAFGGEEVGSVTARPCAGNHKPRLIRLPKSQSVIVNKGLRNAGVEALIVKLKKEFMDRKSGINKEKLCLDLHNDQSFVIGISIARTNDECSVDIEAGIDDYAYSFKRLNEEGIGDYYTINISCPNAFGGEAFATPDLLTKLLARLSIISCTKPVYIKMPINLPWEQFYDLLKVIDFYKLQGVVIGNLNKDYGSLGVRAEAPEEYAGGLSGLPCRQLSSDLISRTRKAYGKRFTIIGVGGIMSVADAREKFAAGADLIQLITGMIWNGPGFMKEICVDLQDFL